MPHVSKKILNTKQERIIKARLVDMLRAVGKDHRSGYSLRELLTYTEMIMLAKRLGIIYLVSKETPTLDICKVFKKLEPSIVDVLETILGAGLPSKYGKGRWKFLNDY